MRRTLHGHRFPMESSFAWTAHPSIVVWEFISASFDQPCSMDGQQHSWSAWSSEVTKELMLSLDNTDSWEVSDPSILFFSSLNLNKHCFITKARVKEPRLLRSTTPLLPRCIENKSSPSLAEVLVPPKGFFRFDDICLLHFCFLEHLFDILW